MTATVARNTWDRVRKAHLPSTGGDAAHTSSPGARTRARTTRGDGTRPQDADGTSAPGSAAPVQDSGGGCSMPTPSADYPPDVRLLAVSGLDPELPGDKVDPSLESPEPDPPPAPGQVSSSPSAAGKVSVDWTARFRSTPEPDVRTALKQGGGKWSAKSSSWCGSSADNLDTLARLVESKGGSFETSLGAQPMT